MDWKIVAAAPLVIENQLPVRGTYLIWETPRVCRKAYFFGKAQVQEHLSKAEQV